MPRGSKPGERRGGRAKGTRNKQLARWDAGVLMEALGCDPLERLVEIAQRSKVPLALRVKVYSELAQYLYPKRRSIDAPAQQNGGPVKVVFEWHQKSGAASPTAPSPAREDSISPGADSEVTQVQ
jgi:hypothetical protein